VQYDDDHTVHYMWPEREIEHDMYPETYREQRYYQCQNCRTEFPRRLGDESGDRRFLDAVRTVEKRVADFLRDHPRCGATASSFGLPTFRSKALDDPGAVGELDRSRDSSDEESLDDELLLQHLSMASSVLGARHWATNLLLLLQLDRSLQRMHMNMLLSSSDSANGDETSAIVLSELAMSIDTLQRLYRFACCLLFYKDLLLDPGHLLSDVTIGVIRALIGLGDAKSRIYAIEWLDKISPYVDRFESPGMQKVVAALRVPQNHSSSEEGTGRDPKRFRADT
jgi:hypothetical protein